MNIYDFNAHMKSLNTEVEKFYIEYYIYKKLFDLIVHMMKMLWELSKQFVW